MDAAQVTQYVTIILAIVGLFSAIAVVTPNKSDDRFVQTLLSFINTFGANFGNAKNKDATYFKDIADSVARRNLTK